VAGSPGADLTNQPPGPFDSDHPDHFHQPALPGGQLKGITVVTYSDDRHEVNHLDDLAARIRAEHEGVHAAIKSGLEHALTAGELLIEAKKRLKHGEWSPWLNEHCKLSERTARLYIRLARHRSLIEAKSATVADLTVRGALELISAPRKPATSSEGNPEGGKRPIGDTQSYAPAHLNSLMWSEANFETRRKFADAVGREVLDYCSPAVRDAILKGWATDTQRKFEHRQREQPPKPLEGDGLDIPNLLKRAPSTRPDEMEAA
jgi:hypothetical protein